MKYIFSSSNTSLIITLDTESGKYGTQITTINDPNITTEGNFIYFFENGKFLRHYSFSQIGTIDGVVPTSIQDAFAKLNVIINNLYLLVSPKFKGSVIPTDTPTGTEDAVWIATQQGTYTNFGGVIVGANSRAEISRVAGVFSISQTAFDISGKVNVSDVIDGFGSTEENKPGSANNDRLLDEKKIEEVNQFEGFAVIDENDNLAFKVDENGLGIEKIRAEGLYGSYYIVDDEGNIAAYCNSIGEWFLNENKEYFEKKLQASNLKIYDLVYQAIDFPLNGDLPVFPTLKYMFAIDNNANYFDNFKRSNYMSRLYREAFSDRIIPVLLNGLKSLPVNYITRNEADVETTTFQLNVTSDNYNPEVLNVDLIKTKREVLAVKQIRLLAFGDSLVAQADKNETNTGDYTWSAGVKVMFEKFNKDSALLDTILSTTTPKINSVVMGTLPMLTNTINYQGATISIRAGAEGRGGWTTASYLRHCANTIGVDSGGSANWFRASSAWTSLGLGKKILWTPTSETNGYDFYASAVEAFTGTDAQKILIRNTPHGKYLPDLNTDLWFALKNYMGYSGSLGASYSIGQHTAMQVAMKDLIEENPINPFFDFALARANGINGYSVLKYLQRYRTMDDLGVRLYGAAGTQAYYDVGLTTIATGYTIGTKATNTLNFDICKPTHIAIQSLGNDHLYGNDGTYGDIGVVGYPELTFAELNTLTDIIKSELPTIYIAILNERNLGSFYPSDEYFYKPIDLWTGVEKYKIAKLLHDFYDVPVKTRISLLPTFFTIPTNSTSDTVECYDFKNGGNIIKTGSDNGHYGYNGIMAVAYDVASWVAYTNNL